MRCNETNPTSYFSSFYDHWMGSYEFYIFFLSLGVSKIFEASKLVLTGNFTTSHPSNYQEKVFGEIAASFLRILFATPEKFHKNPAFHSMLIRISQIKPIHFVIDEAHCIVEQEYFR